MFQKYKYIQHHLDCKYILMAKEVAFYSIHILFHIIDVIRAMVAQWLRTLLPYLDSPRLFKSMCIYFLLLACR